MRLALVPEREVLPLRRSSFSIPIVALLLALPLTAFASRGDLYTDGFSDPASGWLEYEDATLRYAYEDETYGLDVSGAGRLQWSWAPLDPLQQDFVLEVSADLSDGTEGTYGLIWGEDDTNFTLFRISVAGWYIVERMIDGEWVTAPVPWTETYPLSPELPYHMLRVAVHGNTVLLYANGVPLQEVRLPAGDACLVGVLVSTDESPRTAVRFDDFTVSRYSSYGALQRPAGRVLHEERFESLSEDWPAKSSADADLGIEGGAYHVRLTAPSGVHARWSGVSIEGEFVLEAHVASPLDVDGLTILSFGRNSEDDLYDFALMLTYCFATRYLNGEETDLVELTLLDNLHPQGFANRLAVASDGGVLRFYINGVQVGSSSITAPVSGGVHLVVFRPTKGASTVHAVFDNLVIREP